MVLPRLHGRRPKNRRNLLRNDGSHELASNSSRLRNWLLAVAPAFVGRASACLLFAFRLLPAQKSKPDRLKPVLLTKRIEFPRQSRCAFARSRRSCKRGRKPG